MSINPRLLALNVLAQWKDLTLPPHIPERDDREHGWHGLPPRDRNLAFELINGVLRRRLLLDAVINSQLQIPPEQLEIKVRAILWIGVYQLLLHQRAPSYATVHSAVELTKSAGRPRATGLVNAILRNITRLKPTLEVRHGLSSTTFPTDFVYQVRFNAPVFPDPTKDVVAHLSVVTSHPPELIRMLMATCGTPEIEGLLIRNNLRPNMILRADGPLPKLPPADPEHPEKGIVPHKVPGYYVAQDGWSRELENLIVGPDSVLSPQDPTAGKAVRILADTISGSGFTIADLATSTEPPRILDLCAGLGTKSIQLARTFPQATIVATDIDGLKIAALLKRAHQLKITNILPAPISAFASTLKAEARPAPTRDFQVVLLDVPCSNTGVLSRRPQSRWRWPILDRSLMKKTQLQLLDQAMNLLPADTSKHAYIVYSTCSLDPEENQNLVREFLARNQRLILVHEEITLPGLTDIPYEQHDGGYVAILRRNAETLSRP